jgi:hypothetical protein
VDRRIHERQPADFQIRVTAVDDPELSVSGQAIDMSQFGISVCLPSPLTTGSAVRLNIKESVLFGCIAHCEPEKSYFRTGIAVSELLKATLSKAMPEVQRRPAGCTCDMCKCTRHQTEEPQRRVAAYGPFRVVPRVLRAEEPSRI